ncbi:MAG: peptide-methionine (S)-S-oxide reductase MsrA [Leptospirales bacterium]
MHENPRSSIPLLPGVRRRPGVRDAHRRRFVRRRSSPGVVAAVAFFAVGVFACDPANGQAGTTEIELKPTAARGQAVFAGGCFWCMEPPFEKLAGVTAVYSGYTGGPETGPAYKAVAAGKTKHAEAVLVEYDPKKITYEKLLYTYWRSINPTQINGQFFDVGPQYRTAIFYLNDEQKALAEKSKRELAASGKFKEPIAVQIVPPTRFWKAEEYHQDYYKKNPAHYERYAKGSGRKGYLKRTWSVDS